MLDDASGALTEHFKLGGGLLNDEIEDETTYRTMQQDSFSMLSMTKLFSNVSVEK